MRAKPKLDDYPHYPSTRVESRVHIKLNQLIVRLPFYMYAASTLYDSSMLYYLLCSKLYMLHVMYAIHVLISLLILILTTYNIMT